MSRLGLLLGAAFAVVVALTSVIITIRTTRVIERSHTERIAKTAESTLLAVERELAAEALRIESRLEPLAKVRELRFRVLPGQPEFSPIAARSMNSSISPISPDDTASPAPAPEDARQSSGPIDPVGLQRFIEEILPVLGIDSLEIAERSGVVAARGQFPESFGDRRSDRIFLEARSGRRHTSIREEPFRDGKSFALVTAIPIFSGSELDSNVVAVLAGGIRLDRLAARISELTGAEVKISPAPPQTSFSPTVADPSYVFEVPGLISGPAGGYFWKQSIPWRLEGPAKDISPPIGEISIMIPATEIVLARRRLERETWRDGAVAVIASALMGLLLALGPTRRLRRLNDAAIRIGKGDLDAPIEVTGSDEIGLLGATLSETVGALKRERENLARSERVAAWRDAAKRLAHELKNAVTPINISIRTARRATAKGDIGKNIAEESLSAAEEEMTQLRGLVEKFSEFARLPQAEPAPYDLAHALRSAAKLYAGEDREIALELDASLPEILADEELMGRVWANLIGNASHAAGAGGKIAISARPDGDVVRITIADSGPGLPKERIGSPNIEGSSTKPGGWGVGLALTERIVAEHGGELKLENPESGGAAITVILPMAS